MAAEPSKEAVEAIVRLRMSRSPEDLPVETVEEIWRRDIQEDLVAALPIERERWEQERKDEILSKADLHSAEAGHAQRAYKELLASQEQHIRLARGGWEQEVRERALSVTALDAASAPMHPEYDQLSEETKAGERAETKLQVKALLDSIFEKGESDTDALEGGGRR